MYSLIDLCLFFFQFQQYLPHLLILSQLSKHICLQSLLSVEAGLKTHLKMLQSLLTSNSPVSLLPLSVLSESAILIKSIKTHDDDDLI